MTDARFRLPTAWPRPHDIGAAERRIERFAEIGRPEARLATRPAVEAMLRSLGGNRPYLADLAVREAASLVVGMAVSVWHRAAHGRHPADKIPSPKLSGT